MTGWKTWVGVLLLIAGGALTVYGMPDVATVVYATAVPWVVLGLGSKLDKVRKVLHQVATALESASTALETAPPAATATQTVIVTPAAVPEGPPSVPLPVR